MNSEGMKIRFVTNINETQRIRRVIIDTGNIFVIENINNDGEWDIADSSIDNAVITKRLISWGIAKDFESALNLINK